MPYLDNEGVLHMLRHFYRRGALSASETQHLLLEAERLKIPLTGVQSEWCYNVDMASKPTKDQTTALQWLLAETFDPQGFGEQSQLNQEAVFEIGPRLNFETPFSSTAVTICRNCGIPQVRRLERSRRLEFAYRSGQTKELIERELLPRLYDRMTEQVYRQPLTRFSVGKIPVGTPIIPLLEEGPASLERANKQYGFGMDQQDLLFCANLFINLLKRNPTLAELYQLAQANSEHCRHWYFKGKLVVDGVVMPQTLMEIVQEPWRLNPGNSVIAFDDDSSAISAPWSVFSLVAQSPGQHSRYALVLRVLCPTQTAETHCFPTGIAPEPGAETGGGGRIRDNLSVGQGGEMLVSGAAYCTGNLEIPGYPMPWEKGIHLPHPPELASPLEIALKASRGASSYGNCIGEPLIYGFNRTVGLWVGDKYLAYYKPIMYSVGIGQLDQQHTKKGLPEAGMLLLQIGGPAYRIGVGGGAASSMLQGDNLLELDFDAVQRGAPEMEQRVWRVIRACIELGILNPIVSIHDLGAGGDCNAIPEIALPAGARINLRAIHSGDLTLTVADYWANESQEREVLLLLAERLAEFQAICQRENVPCAVVGTITGDGQLVVYDEVCKGNVVDLPLETVLGKLPPKTFHSERWQTQTEPLQLPSDLTIEAALQRVLRLPAVASKRWLTTKVDRSVTGQVAQQQCVGPNQVPLSDYALIAQSIFGETGVAMSLGEQPLKGLISPEAMARLAVSEALLNLAGVAITSRKDIRCSANWMLAAKIDGGGDWLYRAASAMRDVMTKLGSAADGGKDSLTLAAKTKDAAGKPRIVKGPGQLVIANYVTVKDIRQKVTADLKPGSDLVYLDLSGGNCRLGGSALAQVYSQVGNECPDLEDAERLGKTFDAVQSLVKNGLITAVHDRSDGGLITTLLEMAFAGHLGLEVELFSSHEAVPLLFNEELGLVLGCLPEKTEEVLYTLQRAGVAAERIGRSLPTNKVRVRVNGMTMLWGPISHLYTIWEESSSQLERLQANPKCTEREEQLLRKWDRPRPGYSLSYRPTSPLRNGNNKPRIAVVREQGSNGDREMAASLILAGCDVWDVTMTDLLRQRISLEQFRGVVFPGGFSYGDVLDSGKGWAGVIRFNEVLRAEFDRFYRRPDTFSLGVCNGCQFMSLLGWVPFHGTSPEQQPRFIHNQSGRFESRWITLQINPSPAILLRGMEGSVLGAWVAHGEGKLHFPDPKIEAEVRRQQLAPISFVTPSGDSVSADDYPFNPNGSPDGITALCSPDGRHLAMMPHPERLTQLWQWPWLPDEWKDLKASPWLRLFQNAYTWCQES